MEGLPSSALDDPDRRVVLAFLFAVAVGGASVRFGVEESRGDPYGVRPYGESGFGGGIR